jgi:uncharacterized protein YbbC (DUF1343 family)
MRIVEIGLERCLRQPPELLRGARFGLLMNQASVDGSFRYACDLLAERLPGQLVALFSPQHGLWGEAQANMIESPHGLYKPLGLPIYSLYSQTRRPTAEMLRGLDCLVIDLQDVGTRVYTFLWTLRECLIACAAAGVAVIVLDRPNPLGGCIVEGPLLERGFESFVGGASIPLRHGLTLGELSLLLNHEQQIGARLEVVPIAGHHSKQPGCSAAAGLLATGQSSPLAPREENISRSEMTTFVGWQRDMLFEQTGRPWVMPSPNMPRTSTAMLYPGGVLLEGTNLSEGRGTTLPFEVVGAPFIDPQRLLAELAPVSPSSVALRPIRFVPTFDKWRGESCGGIALHIVDPSAVRSVAMTLHILAAVRRLWPREFAWLPPPYEYEREKMPIDILFGSSHLREVLAQDSPAPPDVIEGLTFLDEPAWWRRVQPHLLYE